MHGSGMEWRHPCSGSVETGANGVYVSAIESMAGIRCTACLQNNVNALDATQGCARNAHSTLSCDCEKVI